MVPMESYSKSKEDESRSNFVVVAVLLISVVFLISTPGRPGPAGQVSAKIFTRCELATELYTKYNISWRLIPDWICIADAATGLNSSYVQKSPPTSNHTNYGIFRIHYRYWCHDGFEEKNTCGVNCTDLLGDDITKSVECAQIIYTQDNQFEAWSDWRLKCKNKDVRRYIRDCTMIPGQLPPRMMMPPERRTRTMVADKENQYLTCAATGNPPPDLYWRYNKTASPDLFTRADDKPPKGLVLRRGHEPPNSGEDPPPPTGPISVLKLFFPKMNRRYAGEYSCFAENLAGETEAIYTLTVRDKGKPPPEKGRGKDKPKGKDRDDDWSGESDDEDGDEFFETSNPTLFYSLAVGVPLLVGVLTAVGTAYVYRRWCARRSGHGAGGVTGKGFHDQDGDSTSTTGLTAAEIMEFEEGVPELQHKLISELYVCRENIIYQPYNKLFELDEHKITVDRFNILGSGQFGIVLRGTDTATGAPVAVKTVQAHCTNKLYVKALLSELKILIYLGAHAHIVNLIGARTAKLNEGVVFLFVEFCPLGDLENYLRKRKESFNVCARCGGAGDGGGDGGQHVQAGGTTVTTYQVNVYDHDPISTCDLFRWSAQISSAMEYLGSKKVIHGDLATRNILLLHKSCAKITDFGLAKQLYDYTNYVKTHETPLPWRSLAFESLREMTFSTQSDVWSFGVTLWEIFSLGDIPYTAGTQFSIDFITRLQEGLRLQKPEYAPTELYEEMLKCWSLRPGKRPSFEELRGLLEKMGAECPSLSMSMESESEGTPESPPKLTSDLDETMKTTNEAQSP